MAMEFFPGPNPVFGTLTVIGNITAGTFNNATLDNAAWSTYVPTVTAGSGSFTNVNGATRYKQIGKTVIMSLTINIVTNGTATSFIQVTLPVSTNTNQFTLFPGREVLITGSMIQGFSSGTAISSISKYDNTYPGGDGRVIIMSGVYESA